MGVYARAQLEEAGIARSSLTRRLRSGALVRLLPGVYSDPEPSYIDLCAAVHLWRPDAVLSHATAAYLWDLAWRFHGDLSSSRVKTEEGCSDLR